MRSKAVLLVLVFTWLFATGCSSGGSGEGDSSSSFGKGLKGTQLIPSQLGDRVCDYPEAFNNRSEVILSCRPAGAVFSSYGTVTYALWTGGDSLQDLGSVRNLPPLGPSENYIIAGLADSGAVFGTIGLAEDSADGSSGFAPMRGFRADRDGYLEYPVPIDAVSSSGEYVLTNQFVETSADQGSYETVVYKNQTPVALAPFPAGVSELNTAEDIRNDGTVGGTALVGEVGQTFAASYGYFRSQSSFDLVAPPGRAELASVFAIEINNTGSAVLSVVTNASYSVPDYGDGSPSIQQVDGAAFFGHDGSALEISYGDPQVSIYPSGITDRDLVYGSYDTQSSPDLSPSGSFIFSPRSGFTRLQDIIPGVQGDGTNDSAVLHGVNNANHALVGTKEGIVLIQLPDDL